MLTRPQPDLIAAAGRKPCIERSPWPGEDLAPLNDNERRPGLALMFGTIVVMGIVGIGALGWGVAVLVGGGL
ncbi:hypothetical protein [Methylobacterium sp. ID0610]|uniref:hypothetical protein n=1 Tax=Methylobacterium carpenticola TaxID=3344827 RepID=UPI0036A7F763